jgi:hypothetical protein
LSFAYFCFILHLFLHRFFVSSPKVSQFGGAVGAVGSRGECFVLPSSLAPLRCFEGLEISRLSRSDGNLTDKRIRSGPGSDQTRRRRRSPDLDVLNMSLTVNMSAICPPHSTRPPHVLHTSSTRPHVLLKPLSMSGCPNAADESQRDFNCATVFRTFQKEHCEDLIDLDWGGE